MKASHVNCETVRAYVAQVGLVQARNLARAAGMTAGQAMASKAVPCEEGLTIRHLPYAH